MKLSTLILMCFLVLKTGNVRSNTFSIGSYIINMGVTPQTVGNGMKPYGLVYEFLNTYRVPIYWVIASGKMKDSADFTYSGIKYKGGTFIIAKEHINSTIKSRITYWIGQGVVMDSITTTLTVTVTQTLTSAPRWTISTINSSLATGMFTHAGIPSSSYNSKTPSSLGACDDIFAMPHADPTWAAHGNLYTWNRTYKGAIWGSCHAISVLENLTNPSNSSEQMNFLSTQGLINYGSHADGTPAYSYFFNRSSYNGSPISASAGDPVFQMMGVEDAAHTNGSEQIYVPLSGSGSGWRNTTHIGCYDSTHSNVSSYPNGPAAVTLYGRGFGNSNFGYVMYQGGHNIIGTAAANVSAMRQFFNFSLMAMADKVPVINSYTVNSTMTSGGTYSFSVAAASPVGAGLTYQWSSYCGGTFSDSTSSTTSFNPTGIYSDTNCVITCIVTDACGRVTFLSEPVNIYTSLNVDIFKFDLEEKDGKAVVNWSVSSEENTHGYEIQRSIDGINYHTIGFVNGAIHSSSIVDYGFEDGSLREISQKIVYYRLIIIETDGNRIQGPKGEIVRQGIERGIVSIMPNPADRNVLIKTEMPINRYENIFFYDMYGRMVYSQNTNSSINEHFLQIDISELVSGIYYVRLNGKNGEQYLGTFVKTITIN